jgi:hypothetical protein
MQTADILYKNYNFEKVSQIYTYNAIWLQDSSKQRELKAA